MTFAIYGSIGRSSIPVLELCKTHGFEVESLPLIKYDSSYLQVTSTRDTYDKLFRMRNETTKSNLASSCIRDLGICIICYAMIIFKFPTQRYDTEKEIVPANSQIHSDYFFQVLVGCNRHYYFNQVEGFALSIKRGTMLYSF